jgi:hypothetical protein
MNDMSDLREEVAVRMRQTLHGKEIDMFDADVRIPQMLGIVPIGNTSSSEDEEHTLLDPSHEFWDDYHDDVESVYDVYEKVRTAIESLEEDGILRITYPHGKEAEIAYVEVDEIGRNAPLATTTDCADCDESIKPEITIRESGGYYFLRMNLSCECGYSTIQEMKFTRV